ncbi:MAG: NAD-dependent epimerase/dehydratase family protein [Actinobacteria bacterium]|nr:NAD-dependent epimerase/dehydratase family protein [Actinomycetota bacterium]
MRIAVLGGTAFIGRAIVDELVAERHEVLVIHRGKTEPAGLAEVQHLHAERDRLREHADEISSFQPDVFIDTRALTAADSQTVLDSVGPDVRLAVLSSVDVYLGFQGLHEGTSLQAVPFAEDSLVRTKRYPYRGVVPGMDDYDKLDVEQLYLSRDAMVFRLPFVYGEHDYQRREEFILGRLRAERRRIPFGAGDWLGSRVYVGDVAKGVCLAIASDEAPGQIFNLGEPTTLTMRDLANAIAKAAGGTIEMVKVPDESLPQDLALSGSVAQHVLIDSSKARGVLGWRCQGREATIKTTVEWHISNPPQVSESDFSQDDSALG